MLALHFSCHAPVVFLGQGMRRIRYPPSISTSSKPQPNNNSIARLCSMLARQSKLGLTVAATATVAANSAQASGPQHEHRWHCSGGILDLQSRTGFDPAVFRVVALRLQGFGLSASGGLIISVGSSALVVLVVPVGLLAGLLAPCWLCFGCIGLGHLSCWWACWLACLLRAGCASGASASGASLAGWLAGWLACSLEDLLLFSV